MGQDIVATGTDFHVEFNGLLTQAKVHNLDITDENLLLFLKHIAEVQAQKRASERWLYSIINGRK